VTKLRPDDRRDRILTAITANAALRMSELARELNVSTETIRRDLDFLHEKGLVRRHYGGAIPKPVGTEPTWSERLAALPERKAAIARTAAGLISDNDVLMLGAGATVFTFAKQLAAENRRVTVFTNNLAAGTCFPPESRARVIIAPGEYSPAEGCTLGPETNAFIEKFRVDTVLLSVSGLSTFGGTEVVSGIAWAERAMLGRSARHILMVDHTKFGNSSLELVCKLSEIDVLVTDMMPEADLLEALRMANVEIVVAAD
jgi:DeoR/GlpR family transcriptional regulator of sugar metabolism